MSKQNEISKFYSKREINLIAEYLGRKTTLHPDLLEPNALNPVDENWDESTKGIAIQEEVTPHYLQMNMRWIMQLPVFV